MFQFLEISKPKWYDISDWVDKLLPLDSFKVSPSVKYFEQGIEKLDELISVEEENSGLITVSVLMEDPQLASDIANHISDFVRDFIGYEQHREAKRNKEFVFNLQSEAKSDLTLAEQILTDFYKINPLALGNPEIVLEQERLVRNVEEKQAVYITILQQYEISKIEEARENLLINILDIAEPSVEIEKPKRIIIIILTMIGGLIVSSIYIIASKLEVT